MHTEKKEKARDAIHDVSRGAGEGVYQTIGTVMYSIKDAGIEDVEAELKARVRQGKVLGREIGTA